MKHSLACIAALVIGCWAFGCGSTDRLTPTVGPRQRTVDPTWIDEMHAYAATLVAEDANRTPTCLESCDSACLDTCHIDEIPTPLPLTGRIELTVEADLNVGEVDWKTIQTWIWDHPTCFDSCHRACHVPCQVELTAAAATSEASYDWWVAVLTATAVAESTAEALVTATANP